MKYIFMLTVFSFALNAFAYTTGEVSTVTWMSTAITSGMNVCKEAQEVIKDVNEFHATGKMSPALSEKIHIIQSEKGMSDLEAIDALVISAEETLKANGL